MSTCENSARRSCVVSESLALPCYVKLHGARAVAGRSSREDLLRLLDGLTDERSADSGVHILCRVGVRRAYNCGAAVGQWLSSGRAPFSCPPLSPGHGAFVSRASAIIWSSRLDAAQSNVPFNLLAPCARWNALPIPICRVMCRPWPAPAQRGGEQNRLVMRHP